MAAPVAAVVAAPAAVTAGPTVAAAAVAGMKAAVAFLPGAAVTIIGVVAIFKVAEVGEAAFDKWREKRANKAEKIRMKTEGKAADSVKANIVVTPPPTHANA